MVPLTRSSRDLTVDLRRRPRNQSLPDPSGLDGARQRSRNSIISYAEISYAKRWPRGLVGQNCPIKRPFNSMAWSDGISIIYYIANLFANKWVLTEQVNTLGFILAVARQKLHLQFLRANPLFTFTHDSCVMSTICHRVKSNLRAKNCVRNSSRYHMVRNCVTIQYNISLIHTWFWLTRR